MKRYITITLLSCMCFFSMYAQHSAKDCLYDLYKVLSTYHNKDYIGIGDCNYSISSLYQGKNERIIFDAIKNACIFSYGNPLDSVVEVNLGNKGDSRYLVGIGIYFGKPKKKETFIYNSS